jgi:membrane carboxypeptidase/penicillin-binding protein
MTSLLKNTDENTEFIIPPDVVKIHICPLTSSLSCGACPNAREEFFLKGTEPTQGCSDEQIQRILKPDPQPAQESRDQILEGVRDEAENNNRDRFNPRRRN